MTDRPRDVEGLILEARELPQRDEWGPRAIAVYGAILEHYPDTDVIRTRLAKCYELAGHFDSAIIEYRIVVNRAPGGLHERIARGGIERISEARRREAAEEARERAREAAAAERDRRLAEARSVSSFERARDLAKVARESRDFELALLLHERQLELARTSSERTGTLAAYAATYRRVGSPQKALRLLNDSIEIDASRDRNAPSFTSLVATLCDLGRLDDARNEGESLVAVRSEDPMALNAAGRVYASLYRRDGEVELLDRSNDLFLAAARHRRPDRDVVAELSRQVEIYLSLERVERALEIQNILDRVGIAAEQS